MQVPTRYHRDPKCVIIDERDQIEVMSVASTLQATSTFLQSRLRVKLEMLYGASKTANAPECNRVAKGTKQLAGAQGKNMPLQINNWRGLIDAHTHNV